MEGPVEITAYSNKDVGNLRWCSTPSDRFAPMHLTQWFATQGEAETHARENAESLGSKFIVLKRVGSYSARCEATWGD